MAAQGMPGVLREIGTGYAGKEPFEPVEWRTAFHGVRVTVWEFLKWVYYKSVWKG